MESSLMSDPIRLLIADDHPLVLQGLQSILSGHRDFKIVAVAQGGAEAVTLYRQHRPDVVILDLRMPDMTGLEALEQIRRFDAAARVLMLSTFDCDEDVYRALRLGARAYVVKDAPPSEIISAVLRVWDGQRYVPSRIAEKLMEHIQEPLLTQRELEVLRLAAGGEQNKQIAARLGITVGTVKGYVNNILCKLQARDRTEAVTLGLRRGIISIDGI
jgi:DNA-binding NarL/FixJ family response regulator